MAAASRTATTEKPKTSPTCGATKRGGVGQCARPAGWGTDHVGFGACKLHTGSTSRGRTHAARLRVADLVRDAPIGGRDGIDRALGKLNGYVNALEQELTSGKLLTPKGEPNPRVRELLVACRELAQIGKLAADAGLDERRVEISERVATAVLDAWYAALGELGVEITPAVREVTRRHLTLVEGDMEAAA